MVDAFAIGKQVGNDASQLPRPQAAALVSEAFGAPVKMEFEKAKCLRDDCLT